VRNYVKAIQFVCLVTYQLLVHVRGFLLFVYISLLISDSGVKVLFEVHYLIEYEVFRFAYNFYAVSARLLPTVFIHNRTRFINFLVAFS